MKTLLALALLSMGTQCTRAPEGASAASVAIAHGIAAASPPVTVSPLVPLIHCPYPATAKADGCAAATAGTVQHPDFFTGWAAQSGQHYTTRPAHNVAGVDYPVGVPPGPLRDPRAAGALPAGCAYASASLTVNCTGSGDLTLSGYDFDGVRLHVYGGYTGTCTLSGDHFKGEAAIDLDNGNLVRIDSNATCALIDAHNTYDGNGTRHMAYLMMDLRTGAVPTFHGYNAWLNIPQKGVAMNAAAPSVFAYNWGQDIAIDQCSHGELTIYGAIKGRALHEEGYNTVIETAHPFNPACGLHGGITTWFYDGGGVSTGFDLYNHDNVIVTNAVNGKAVISAQVELSNGVYPSVRIQRNYIDGAGALWCAADPNGGGKVTGTADFTGNINLVSGKTVPAGFAAKATGQGRIEKSC
jgi:hypothetical protein